VDFVQRAARNEEIFRGVNERIEDGAEQHGVEGTLPFHCECGSGVCVETIELLLSEYERVAHHRYRFVVVPGHEDPSIERVVERHPAWLVVEKTGEARDQIDRDHHT
jgi:hypothetical protein